MTSLVAWLRRVFGCAVCGEFGHSKNDHCLRHDRRHAVVLEPWAKNGFIWACQECYDERAQQAAASERAAMRRAQQQVVFEREDLARRIAKHLHQLQLQQKDRNVR